MVKYRILLRYNAYAEKTIEADSEEEAINIAFDNLDMFNFDGDYDIVDIEKIGVFE